MVKVVSLFENENEKQNIENAIHHFAAVSSDEKWELHSFFNVPELEDFLSRDPVVDLAGWHILSEEKFETLAGFRSGHKSSFILLITDSRISPMKYLRPAIAPNALLLTPYNEDQLHTVVGELIDAYMGEFYKDSMEESFLIETREGSQRVPYSQIYYIEARDKKIYIRTQSEEFGFYDTIDEMMNKLPEYFIRCHRSFIVNMKKAVRFISADNIIEMPGKFAVPVSRSYKKTVKEFNMV